MERIIRELGIDTDPSVIEPLRNAREARISDEATMDVIREADYTIAPTPLMDDLRKRGVEFTREGVRYRLGQLVKKGRLYKTDDGQYVVIKTSVLDKEPREAEIRREPEAMDAQYESRPNPDDGPLPFS